MTNSLDKVLKKLQPRQAGFIQRKYEVRSVGSLSESQLLLTAQILIKSICLITGWSIPEKEDLEAFYRQFTKFLLESNSTLNHIEIEYAFRNKSSEIRDWGKKINLSLITEVLYPYKEERRFASELENAELARLSAPPPETLPKVPPFEMLMVSWESWLLSKRATFRWQFISVTAYDYLSENGYLVLTDEQKRVYMQQARSFIAMQMKEDEKTFYGSDLVEIRKGYAKRLAVNAYFHEAKETLSVLKAIFS